MPPAIESIDPRALESLLQSAHCTDASAAQPLTGGGNNRAFRLDTAAGPLLLKHYFRHPDDPRDRLAHEFAFSRFAWDQGLRCLPQPLAKNDEHALGLYRFIPGQMLKPHEVTRDHVDQAIAFFAQLNQHRNHPDAAELPAGSEACFSNLEHVALVDQRLRKLDAIADPAAAAFIERELKPAWANLHPKIAQAQDAMIPAPRCLSPSDFGFHNALLPQAPQTLAGQPQPKKLPAKLPGALPGGGLVFHDFEYAGWDDPAKLLGDFFHQPRRPAPWSSYPTFEDAIIETLDLDDAQRHRFRTLLPVYRIKWCSIILAPLLPQAAARRHYAGAQRPPAELVEAAHQRLRSPTPAP